GGGVGRVIAQGGQLRGVVGGLAGGEQVDQGGIGREADRLVLVGHGALGRRPPAVAVGHGGDRDRVVGRQGVVDRGVDHRQRPRRDRGAGVGRRDGVEDL